ncbi:Lrp/AsnC family transcriptional regulator [[Eubacterium] cellulosolvens]
MRNTLDDLDWKILDILKKDARTSYVTIAKKFKVSEGMIRQRVKKLLDGGVIKRFTTVTATHALEAIIEVSVALNVHTTKVGNSIKKIEGVENVYEVSGNRDIVAIVDVNNSLKLNDVIEEIRSMKNVHSTETKLVLKEI